MEGGKVLPKGLKSRVTQSISTLRINSVRPYLSDKIECSNQKLQHKGARPDLWAAVDNKHKFQKKTFACCRRELIKPQPRAFSNFQLFSTQQGQTKGRLGRRIDRGHRDFHVLCHIKYPFVDQLMSLHSVIFMPVRKSSFLSGLCLSSCQFF